MKEVRRVLKIVPALTARTQFGQILKRVRQNQERFVMDKRGKTPGRHRERRRLPAELCATSRRARKNSAGGQGHTAEFPSPCGKSMSKSGAIAARAAGMLKAVLGTNVVVSAHLNPDGQEALILELAIAGHFRCFVSEALFEEYVGVLRSERFGFNPNDVVRSIRVIRKTTTLVVPCRKLNATHDQDDNKVLECALEARRDYIGKENIRYFPTRFQGIRTVPHSGS